MRHGHRFRAAAGVYCQHGGDARRHDWAAPGRRLLARTDGLPRTLRATRTTGISTYPISMLKGSEELLKELRINNCFTPEFSGLTIVDFSDVAQQINVYADYAKKGR